MISQIIDRARQRYSRDDVKIIEKAVEIATEKHRGHKRLDNTEYLDHVLSVAEILMDWLAPVNVLTAGILHDILKPQYVNLPEDISWKDSFPENIASIVEDVNEIDIYLQQLQNNNKDLSAQDLKLSKTKLLHSLINKDPEAIIIKLADRLHNLRTAENLSEERRESFLQNIRYLAVSIASRLGMGRVSRELQDRCFELLEPELYQKSNKIYEEACRNEELDKLIHEIRKALGEVVDDAYIHKFISSRYNIYRATLERNGTAPSVWDVSYINITVKNIKDCYTALGVIHSQKNFETTDHLKDFIAKPKSNGYRAIHTKLWKKGAGHFQIAITTEEMGNVAEYGYAAIWMGIDINHIPNYRQTIPSDGEISVLTPYGKIVPLKPGATPVDFAFRIHSEVGFNYMYALVNGDWKAPDTLLEDGDVVDIITSKTPLDPDNKWTGFVQDSARTAIESRLKKIPYKFYEFKIVGFDRIGLLQEIVRVFSNTYFNIISMQALQQPGNRFEIVCEVEDRNRVKAEIACQMFENLGNELRSLTSIISVEAESIEKPLNKIRTNPYSIFSKAASNFKGRASEIDGIVRSLRESYEHNSTIIISGQYRIGKTSLLEYLRDSVLPDKNVFNIYLSIENVVDAKTDVVESILFEIAERLFRSLQNHSGFNSHDRPYNTPEWNLKELDRQKFRESPFDAFSDFLLSLKQTRLPLRVIVMIDECQKIDGLSEEQQKGFEHLFKYFRSLLRDRFNSFNLTLIVCGVDVSVSHGERICTRSLADIAKCIQLDCLDYEAAKSLIISPNSAAESNIEFEDAAVERLISVTACHPFYIQYLCKDLYDKAPFLNPNEGENKYLITVADVNLLLKDHFKRPNHIQMYISHFWELGIENNIKLSAANRLILTVIANLNKNNQKATIKNIIGRIKNVFSQDQIRQCLEYLIDYGTILEKSDIYEIKIPLLSMWLCETQPLQKKLRKASAGRINDSLIN